MATALGYSHYYIVAVIIIIGLWLHDPYWSTDRRTELAYKTSRLHLCKKSKNDYFFYENRNSILCTSPVKHNFLIDEYADVK